MKRIFILLLCGAALLACKKDGEPGGGGSGEPQLPVSVVGTVKGSDNTLLEGVVVSDGITCVKTDASGDPRRFLREVRRDEQEPLCTLRRPR